MNPRPLFLAAIVALCALARGQESHPAPNASPSAGAAEIRFTYDHPKLTPSHYVIVVTEDGKGHYTSALAPDTPKPDMTGLASQPLDREITVTSPTRQLLFSTARQRKLFAITCESGQGNVAFRGNKELAYTGRDGQGTCKFNWSKDQQIDKVSDIFQSLAFTLEEGGKLAVEHRHDRLALDAELQLLATAAKENRAVELQNIAPELQEIAQDELVMSRARQRARQLLEAASRD